MRNRVKNKLVTSIRCKCIRNSTLSLTNYWSSSHTLIDINTHIMVRIQPTSTTKRAGLLHRKPHVEAVRINRVLTKRDLLHSLLLLELA